MSNQNYDNVGTNDLERRPVKVNENLPSTEFRESIPPLEAVSYTHLRAHET